MRLFKQLIYKLSKNETPSILIDKVKYVLSELNCTNISSKLYVVDDKYAKFSYTQRAIKRFPILQKYNSDKDIDIISNLDNDWDVENPYPEQESIPLDVMELIAKGIPKSFAFHKSLLIFENIDWFGTGVININPIIHLKRPTPYAPYLYLSSSIIIQSDWDANGRDNRLYVTLELPIPEYSHTIPPMDSKIQRILESLGTIQNINYHSTLTQDELLLFNSSIRKCESLWNEYKDNLFNLIDKNVPEVKYKEVVLSHEKCMNSIRESFMNAFNSKDFSKIRDESKEVSKSPKKVIIKQFSKKGFSYLEIPGYAAIGTYVLTKRTSHNNLLVVSFDYWARGGEISCNVAYKVPFYKHNMDLPIAEEKGIRTSYPVDDENALTTVVTNCLYIIEYLENTLFNELDNIYGYAPEWYIY